MTDTATAIRIDSDGRFVDQSGQLFPIGLYSVPHEDTFAELKAAGFNTVHSYEFERKCFVNLQCSRDVNREYKDFDGLGDEAARSYLDAAASQGLKVAMGFNRPGGVSRGVFSEKGRVQIEARIKALRDHPALLAWYLADEPDGQDFDPESVRECRRFVESLDPNHPTLTVLCVPEKFAQYAEAGSVMMADPYPLRRDPGKPSDPIWEVGRYMSMLKDAVGPAVPTVAVLQAFEWKAYDYRIKESQPVTREELRCMTWQAIVANVSGVLFFSYHNELQSLRACDSPERWADISAVAGELQALMPALLAPLTDEMQVVGDVQATFRKVGADIWVIATNPETDAGRATFALPEGVSKATVTDCLDGSKTFEATGEFSVDLEPRGSVAMRVTLPTA